MSTTARLLHGGVCVEITIHGERVMLLQHKSRLTDQFGLNRISMDWLPAIIVYLGEKFYGETRMQHNYNNNLL
jgi:hypothetical protein